MISVIALSIKEQQILLCVAMGMTARETSQYLHIGYRTVEKYLEIIRQKLLAKNTTHAVFIATTRHLIYSYEKNS